MKKKYICPTVLIVNIEDEIILAGSPELTSNGPTSGQNTGDDDDPANWAH